ncbi:hypothetical protein PV755_09400 [Streptomyces caniscabiei]|uniref:Uncharacterized protein n=1 Tax=Streptomyces caniscabiei TaxID=2746961 RepID=A0A927KXK9_9ACTN|nr:hypothetical protein [Streptomyces caniscabiei]MBD9721945.1 hypothetical protein [Streptomyces caniscabiei]MDX3509137.1 hypothetical protein [Streptomyces caniscabiei]MDX3717110.1 hypothetical protein [Streptomyces caniscabiei]WEO22978.1 hypothetical protein IHE65_07325 [Streptomyces caniscabiei]
MSQILFDADLSATELGARRRKNATVAEMYESLVADLFADYVTARAAADGEEMQLILDRAAVVDPRLVDELAGFDYPAAA